MSRLALTLSFCFIACLSEIAIGATTFYVSPGVIPTGDAAFRDAVGHPARFDFEAYDHLQLIDSFDVESVNVDVALIDIDGLLVSEVAQIFRGDYAGSGGTPTTVSGAALGSFSDVINIQTMRLTFSTPLSAFGVWIFDDSSISDETYRLTVTETGGVTSTSSVLNASNGLGGVEGFLGVTSTTGITSLLIESQSTNPISVFEIDNIQLVAVPEPSGLVMASTACALLVISMLVNAVRFPRLYRV